MSEEQSQFEQYLSTPASDLVDELNILLVQCELSKDLPIDVKVHLAMLNLGLRLVVEDPDHNWDDDEHDDEGQENTCQSESCSSSDSIDPNVLPFELDILD